MVQKEKIRLTKVFDGIREGVGWGGGIKVISLTAFEVKKQVKKKCLKLKQLNSFANRFQ
jgi:hypothetical protein